MASNHENDRLPDEIPKQTEKKNPTAPAAKPQERDATTQKPAQQPYEPKREVKHYEPKHAAPERSVSEPSEMEKTTIRQTPDMTRRTAADPLDVPVAGEERPQVRPRPQQTRAQREAAAKKKKRRRRNKSYT